ncbi:hypothetical protein [Erythrobacter litoralis]|uniref:TonB-dependent receptor-like beta-barrel domain-containing protein n=1 Tax=Erythrobacter litoralis (strain HTCC2594) TaxID=314225 RepID=Q2NCK1_ERYLH|nr:hypothetical protein [Erythrobacter litoralis]ABC62590.1 hypothetical protein ELI_02490 [Erythrobacter litoralis HTCC2594]
MALVFASPGFAQQAQPSGPDGSETAPDDEAARTADGTIVVTADRLPGQLDVPQAPLVELDAEDIAGFGVGSIQELVAQLEPASGSARGRGGGRPVFLINGIRVSSFREFFRYPPEALEKVEVLPEEVAQRFGFPPDRRVINFILKDDFSSREVELEYEQPDRGGYTRTEQEFGYLAIAAGGRLNLNFEANDTSLLTEAERDIVQTPGSLPTVAGDPDPAAARSLVADSRGFEGSINWASAFQESGGSLSLTGQLERQKSRSLSGLDSVTLTGPGGASEFRTFNGDDPLERRSVTDAASIEMAYSQPLGDWQFTVTAGGNVSDTRLEIDRRADTAVLQAAALNGSLALTAPIPGQPDPGFDIAITETAGATGKATLRGTPFLLPAGEASLTVDAGYDWSYIDSDDTRSAVGSNLSRAIVEGGVNLGIPLTSKRENFLGAVGDFDLNLQAGIDHLSDFGTLRDFSIGLNWEPFDDFQLGVTYVDNEAAPSLGFLGNPVTTTFNVPVFDFATGRTELVTVTDGGNPNLLAESQRDWKFSANWKLPVDGDVRLNVDYVRNRSSDVSQGFPALTDAIEAAFPGRATRDAAGRLVALDTRPVTFEETRAERISFGLNMRGQIGKRPERPEGGPPGAARGASPSTGGPEARGGGGGGAFDPARMQALRDRFCATPEGKTPDLTGVPEPILARLRGEDGQIDPERLKQLRARFCTEEGQQQADDRFARMRAALCGETPDLDALPPQMAARLRREDGTIDPERLERVKQRVCNREGGDGAVGDGAGGAGAGGAGEGSGQGGQQARGGGRGGGGFNPFTGRGNRDPRPRYFLSLNHTVELENTILIAQGVPLLDQLRGDATSTFGLPRHSTRLEGGLFFGGIGTRISARYTGKAFVEGSGLPGSSDLFIDDLATVDLRVFANIGELAGEEEGFLKGLRISLRADNIFDGRRVVRDQNGDTPLRFQPFLIDPTGRYLGVDIRKLF